MGNLLSNNYSIMFLMSSPELILTKKRCGSHPIKLVKFRHGSWRVIPLSLLNDGFVGPDLGHGPPPTPVTTSSRPTIGQAYCFAGLASRITAPSVSDMMSRANLSAWSISLVLSEA